MGSLAMSYNASHSRRSAWYCLFSTNVISEYTSLACILTRPFFLSQNSWYKLQESSRHSNRSFGPAFNYLHFSLPRKGSEANSYDTVRAETAFLHKIALIFVSD